ncbi:MAG: 3-oxoacyl-ACP reductase FabG [Dysgonamonadaceae bacterium]|nr:3-oxoacyl-ACP reductase FabG [Dysgonamonadaceae bacterium]
MSVEGKNIIVSGGSRGIGKAIVLLLAEEGANVAFTYLNNEDAANKVLSESQSLKGSVKDYQVDIRNQQQVKKFISEVVAEWKCIDVVVNNAGIRKDKTMAFMSAEEWNDVIDTNLSGAFYLTQASIFHMLKKKSGRVIFVSSISGIFGIAGQVNYSSAKAALFGMTHSLAKEVAPYGICVNAVAPGGVYTDMVSSMDEKDKERLLQGVPLGRMCRTDEVASVVKFLADSDLSPEYLTGTVIPLDGGMGL